MGDQKMEESEYFSEQVLRWQGYSAKPKPESLIAVEESMEEDISANGYEGLLIEDGKVVGITATVDVKQEKVTATDVSGW